MKMSGVELKLSSDFPRYGKRDMEYPTRWKKRGDQIDRPISHGLAIMRVHSALQRAFPHGQLRKTAAIDLRGRRHGGRNGHVGFGFRVRVINSFAASVYIHSASRSPHTDVRIHHFTIPSARVG